MVPPTLAELDLAPAAIAPDSVQALAALELSRRPGIGAATFRAALERHGTPAAALAAWEPPAHARRKSPTREGLERGRCWVEQGETLLWFGGPRYPETLWSLGEPPPVLFVAGEARALSGRLVAVVGGREDDAAALAAARGVGQQCAERGLTVVSGAARGVDAAAMSGALDAGGHAVAVLGCGVDVVYPPEHGALLQRCAAAGAVVSELLPGTPPARSFFVTRNRIVAALGRASLLVWGRPGSGALVTLEWARRLDRPAAAVSWPEPGAHDEARARGAIVIALEEVSRWLETGTVRSK